MTTLAIARRQPRQLAKFTPQLEALPSPVALLEVEFDRRNAAVWVNLAPFSPKHISAQILTEFSAISARIASGEYGDVRFKVLSSRIAGTFSLGGDLELFLKLIQSRSRHELLEYGRTAVEEIWANVTGCGQNQLATIALVSGEAQGGGFEAALSCHLIVAEQGANFGFPESLFGLRPGMGAIPLLAARTDLAVANRLTVTANRYRAEFLRDIGIIDFVVPAGTGQKFVKSLTARSPLELIRRRKAQFAGITFASLRKSVEHWVDDALSLSDKHKRAMAYLLSAQTRAH